MHPATAKKLRREGLLHARELKRKDGGVYYTVYLKEENKEFLKKYPKKEFKLQVTMRAKGGEVIELSK